MRSLGVTSRYYGPSRLIRKGAESKWQTQEIYCDTDLTRAALDKINYISRLDPTECYNSEEMMALLPDWFSKLENDVQHH